jgi:hypothetical protein
VILLNFQTCGFGIENDLPHLMDYRSPNRRSMAMFAS